MLGRADIGVKDIALPAAVALCCSLTACTADVIWTDVGVTIARPTAQRCRLDQSAPLIVTALGDFPPTGNNVERFDPALGPLSIERFPLDTRYLTFAHENAESPAAGVLVRGPSQLDASVLLLPLGRSCPSPDSAARAPDGAAVAALPDGSLLIAGGRDTGAAPNDEVRAVANAVWLPPGSERVTLLANEMLLRRAGATASVLGAQVLVIGGGPHDRGPAHDTFEVFDPSTQRFTASSDAKLVHGPRRDHGAASVLGGTEVLIVGGVSERGQPPLRSAEFVSRTGTRDAGMLREARLRPDVHVLSNGDVLIVGGVNERGELVRSVESFSPRRPAFSGLSSELPAGVRAHSATLVGDRVGIVTCDQTLCRVSLWLLGGRDVRVIDDVALLPSLVNIQGIGLADGTLLVVGQRRLSDLAEAFVVDVAAGTVSTTEASRVATVLVMLADGALAELDRDGLSLRRTHLTTPLDNAPATLIAGDRELTRDRVAHWRTDGGELIAQVDDARLDVAGLRFAQMRLAFDAAVAGAQELLLHLTSDAAERVTVTINVGEIRIEACTQTRSSGTGPVIITRRDNWIELSDGASSTRCPVTLTGRNGIALVAAEGVAIGPLSVQRL